MSLLDLPRGIRNNNALNIKRGAPWNGLARLDQIPEELKNEKIFCIFVRPEFGIRAAVRTMRTYKVKHGINTVNGLIRRWSATDQESYIRTVVAEGDAHAWIAIGLSQSKFTRNSKIDLTDYDTLEWLLPVMIQVETGRGSYYTDHQIDIALMMAEIEVPPKFG